MKPAAFTYHRPNSVDEAVSILGDVAAEGGRVLAGGQSLVPMMALRVIDARHLVDINPITSLEQIEVHGQGVQVGALARHAHFQRSVAPGALGQLLASVATNIAHYPIRQRGTFCGSLAHADPASEWCLVAVTLGARMLARSRNGSRTIDADKFFLGAMTTCLEPDELLMQVHLPLIAADAGAGFCEFRRRAGDFAVGMSLASFKLSDGVITDPRIGVGGLEEVPRRISQAEQVLDGRPPSAGSFRAAAEVASSAIAPLEDMHTSAAYRRSVARMVVRRALEQAMRTLTAGTA